MEGENGKAVPRIVIKRVGLNSLMMMIIIIIIRTVWRSEEM